MEKLNQHYISFEGIDGTGKSSTLKDVQKYYQANQDALPYKVFTTREPGGTKQADRVRHLLLDSKSDNMSAATQAYLMASARSDLITEQIIPHLKNFNLVLSDRCLLSSLAYQGQKLPYQSILTINYAATRQLKIIPNIIFYFKPTDIKAIEKRLSGRNHKKSDWIDDKISHDKQMANIQTAYQKAIDYWQKHFTKVVTINANNSRKQRRNQVIQYMKYLVD